MTGPYELRIGDAEREAAVSALGEHYIAGRLTKQEYDERADRALAARTQMELFPLFADLPRPQSAARPSVVVAPGRAGHNGHAGHGARHRAGLLPVLLIVLGLLMLLHSPAFVLIVLGAWFLFTRLRRW
jgi:uncharacterized protein DUF1707